MPIRMAHDIMSPLDMFEVSIDDSAAEVSEKVIRFGRSALIEVGDSQPIAILSPVVSQRLRGKPGPLSAHFKQLTVTGLTLPEAPVKQLVQSLTYDRSLEAFIVMNREQKVGLVGFSALYRLAGRLRSNFSPIDPPAGLVCYCCPRQDTHDSHQVSRREAFFNAQNGVSYCPDHKTPLIPKVPCTTC